MAFGLMTILLLSANMVELQVEFSSYQPRRERLSKRWNFHPLDICDTIMGWYSSNSHRLSGNGSLLLFEILQFLINKLIPLSRVGSLSYETPRPTQFFVDIVPECDGEMKTAFRTNSKYLAVFWALNNRGSRVTLFDLQAIKKTKANVAFNFEVRQL